MELYIKASDQATWAYHTLQEPSLNPNIIAVNNDLSSVNIVGLEAAPSGTVRTITNRGANSVVLTANSTEVGAANRFSAALTIPAYGSGVVISIGTGWVPLTGVGGSASDETVTFTDVTTNNASTTKHGFLKKLSGTATEFMNGAGNWAVPAGITNAAGANVIAKSNGTNLVASNISDNGTSVTMSPAAGGSVIVQQAATPTVDIWKALANGGATLIKFTKDGCVLGPNGTKAAPTFAFATDVSTGFYTLGSNYMALSLAGSHLWDVGTAGRMRVAGSGAQYALGVTDLDALDATVGFGFVANGIAKITDGQSGYGSLLFGEVTAPANPAADTFVIYGQDNGSGKTQAMIKFATGAAIQLAIQA